MLWLIFSGKGLQKGTARWLHQKKNSLGFTRRHFCTTSTKLDIAKLLRKANGSLRAQAPCGCDFFFIRVLFLYLGERRWERCWLLFLNCNTHTSAYVSIRQHTSAYKRQHKSAYVSIQTSAYVSIRQHTSQKDVDCYSWTVTHTRQHTSAYVSIRQHTNVSINQHTSAYKRQHTSAYVSTRHRKMLTAILEL